MIVPQGQLSSRWLTFFTLLVMSVVVAGGGILIAAVVPPPVHAKRSEARHTHSLFSHRPKERTACTVGETWDTDLRICTPVANSPLALDGTIMDSSKTACDDFFGLMCGKWNQQHNDEHRTWSYVYRRNNVYIRRFILEEQGPLHDFHQSCVRTYPKEIKIEYAHMMQSIAGALRSSADVPRVLGLLARAGYTGAWTLSIDRNPFRPEVIPVIEYDNFVELDETAVVRLIQDTRETTGWNIVQQQQKAQGVLRIVKTLAQHHLAAKSPEGIARFDAIAPTWKWNLYLQALDGHGLRFPRDQHIWLGRGMLDYLNWLLSSDNVFELDDWRSFIEFSILYNCHNFRPKLPSNAYFRMMHGTITRKRRDTRDTGVTNTTEFCLELTQYALPGLVAKKFLDVTFPEGSKEPIRQELLEMVRKLVETMKRLLNQSTTWLDDQDRAILVDKANRTIVRVIEPDEWEEEQFAASISPDRFDHNMNLVRRWRVLQNLRLWEGPGHFNRKALALFAMPLTEVNAFYSPITNSIALLAGIVQPPLYLQTYNAISKYAILGTIIGHELSHMLDPNGLYFDAQGNYVPAGILSPRGMRSFFERTECVVAEYGPAPGGCNNLNVPYGNKTVGEDSADLLGIRLAYHALFDGTNPSLADRQQFFMIFSQAFCASYSQELLCYMVEHDVHATAEYRINRSTRNTPEFLAAFGCPSRITCHVY